jgi:hypothetical protein
MSIYFFNIERKEVKSSSSASRQATHLTKLFDDVIATASDRDLHHGGGKSDVQEVVSSLSYSWRKLLRSKGPGTFIGNAFRVLMDIIALILVGAITTIFRGIIIPFQFIAVIVIKLGYGWMLFKVPFNIMRHGEAEAQRILQDDINSMPEEEKHCLSRFVELFTTFPGYAKIEEFH